MKTSYFGINESYGCALSRLKEVASWLDLKQEGMVYQTTLSLLQEHRAYVSKKRVYLRLSNSDRILSSFLEIVNAIIPIALGDYYEDALG